MCLVALIFLPIVIDLFKATGVLGFTGLKRAVAATKD
jgi:hypothetical protein